MIEIYFDNVLINSDNYTYLSNDYKLFTDNFKLGSVASNSFKLSVDKSVITTQPTDVKIEDDNTSFYLVVDSIVEDNYVYTYTLTDKLVNFNFNYDANTIIQSKIALEETCYLSDIWKDMCSQAGVDYDDTYTFLNDKEVTWYDNTIQARKYLSYIAEKQGGYACILENGKQSFKPYKKASSKTISIDECSDFILGEKKTITRVIYDNGTDIWEFGDDTGSTLYLDNTNVFITTESDVEEIYDLIVDFEFYIVEVPDAPMDSNVRAGDVITFTDGTNNYSTIAQYSMTYGGGWVGKYFLKVNTDKQEETQLIKAKDQIKSIKSIVDRANATLSIISEQTDENISNVSKLQITTDAITSSVQEIDNSINGTEILDDNLFILTDDTTTINGLTITVSSNVITIDGTATSNTEYDLAQELTLPVSNYSVDGLIDDVNLLITDSESNVVYNNGNDNFEITEEITIDSFKLSITSGSVFDNQVFTPSLAKILIGSGILEQLNDVKSAIDTINSTMMTQTSTAFEMLFTQTGIQDTVNTLQEILSGNTTSLETLRQYIRFEGASITLGKSDSQASLIVTNDRISFMNGSNESAYITGNQLYITDSTILNKLQVGSWETKPDSYGNLNTRWVGGE